MPKNKSKKTVNVGHVVNIVNKKKKKNKKTVKQNGVPKAHAGTTLLSGKPLEMMSVAKKYSVLSAGRKNYANIVSSKMTGGVQTTTVSFGQYVCPLLGRNNSNHILSDSSGMPMQGLPVAPYYIGGLLWDIAKNYDQYRFVNLEVNIIPTAGTEQSGTYTCAYLPNGADLVAVNRMEPNGDSSIFGVLGSAFKAALGATASAAVSVFAPLAVSVGKEALKGLTGAVGSSLSTAAAKYFQNKKIAVANLRELATQIEDQLARAESAKELDDAAIAWMQSLLSENPTLTNSSAIPAALVSPIVNGADALALAHTLLTQAENELCCSLGLNCHGTLLLSTQDPILPGNNTGITPLGSLYISGTVELIGLTGFSLATSGSVSSTYGDPLDDIDPDPSHMSYAAPDRSAYLAVAIRGFATFAMQTLKKQSWGTARVARPIRTNSDWEWLQNYTRNTKSKDKVLIPRVPAPSRQEVARMDSLGDLEAAKLVSSLQRALALSNSQNPAGESIRKILLDAGLIHASDMETVLVSSVPQPFIPRS